MIASKSLWACPGELVINPVFAAFARHGGFTAKACWPNRPQTKGNDERGVGM